MAKVMQPSTLFKYAAAATLLTSTPQLPANLPEKFHITPSAESRDYVENKKQFQLHTLLTEQRHPHTWNLSQEVEHSTFAAVRSLLSVDRDITTTFEKLQGNLKPLQEVAESIESAILDGRRIYIYGCGSTGRLAKQIESTFWRPFWKKMQTHPKWNEIKTHFTNIENRLTGEITGGDRALISSLPAFEDLPLIGKLQLEDHGIKKGDVVISVTEGGETSSVIGTIEAAAALYEENEAQKNLFFVYNNPNDKLIPFTRTRNVLENPAIRKICLATGPQAISGSTRMQATTSEMFVLGVILEQAIHNVLSNYLSSQDLDEIGFAKNTTLASRLASFAPIQEGVYEAAEQISRLTDAEAETYKNSRFSTYFANQGIISGFIDATERSPTFRLLPLDTVHEQQRKAWYQVWTPAQNGQEAWNNILGRPFKGLERDDYLSAFEQLIEDSYLKATALTSLERAGTSEQDLYDLSFSPDNVNKRAPRDGDLGVLILLPEEVENLSKEESTFHAFITLCRENKAKVGAFVASKKARDFFPQGAIVVEIPVDYTYDPLQVRQQVALKMALNAHSTAVMAKIGRVEGNTMINVQPSNLKLIGRATYLIMSHINDHLPQSKHVNYEEVNALLFDAISYCKTTPKEGQTAECSLVIIRALEALKNDRIISWKDSEALLEEYGLPGYLHAL